MAPYHEDAEKDWNNVVKLLRLQIRAEFATCQTILFDAPYDSTEPAHMQ